MHSYSVFNKSVDALQITDLPRLFEVSEGWYVEYKRLVPSVSSVAKSLSAFANSYGGWVFYGVEENGDGSRRAGSFPGIVSADVPQMEEWLQQAASQHVTPSPYFNHRVLNGPDDSIGLPPERAILVVHVPMGKNPPYVHSSGRIYRRVADASDPVHETDRHFLDLLWQRGKESRRSFSKFVKKEAEISKGEHDVTFLRLLLIPDPWGERVPFQTRFQGFLTDYERSKLRLGWDTIR